MAGVAVAGVCWQMRVWRRDVAAFALAALSCWTMCVPAGGAAFSGAFHCGNGGFAGAWPQRMELADGTLAVV